MKTQKIKAPNMREAMRLIRHTMGNDAVILNQKNLPDGIEVTVTLEEDLQGALQEVEQTTQFDASNFLTDDEISSVSSTSENVTIDAMKHEISSLRNLLEVELASLTWGRTKKSHPMKALMMKRLTAMGFQADFIDRIVMKLPQDLTEEKAWQYTYQELQAFIPVEDFDATVPTRAIALVGPTGVGKTTTIAKLAARYVLKYGADKVALIGTDAFRICATEQLQSYANILGVAMYRVDSDKDLTKALEQTKDKKIVLVDTYGASQRDIRLIQSLQNLRHHCELTNYLLISATTDYRVTQQIIRAFAPADLHGCMISKVDEATALGPTLSAVSEAKLPVCLLTNGQNVPDDLELVDSASIIKHAERLANKYNYKTSSSPLTLMQQGFL